MRNGQFIYLYYGSLGSVLKSQIYAQNMYSTKASKIILSAMTYQPNEQDDFIGESPW
jgi:hypothetical protein